MKSEVVVLQLGDAGLIGTSQYCESILKLLWNLTWKQKTNKKIPKKQKNPTQTNEINN